MQTFSFHLTETTPATTIGALYRPPTGRKIAGLRHAECMAAMTLGSPILSKERIQLRNLAVFASWESEAALDDFLADTRLGRTLARGWHVRLKFLRRWGRHSGFDDLPPNIEDSDSARPVVAVTLARARLPELARFIRWGKPVEEQVRDHPATILALAAIRPPRTFSTFSIWRTQREMTEMVHGKGSSPGAERHAKAMDERDRRDFHHEFTTLRFRAIAEHGEWMGKSGLVPK